MADGVEARGDDEAVPADPPADLPGAEPLLPAGGGGNARYPAGRRLQPGNESGGLFADFSTAGGGRGASAGGLVAAVTRKPGAAGASGRCCRVAGFPGDFRYLEGGFSPGDCLFHDSSRLLGNLLSNSSALRL